MRFIKQMQILTYSIFLRLLFSLLNISKKQFCRKRGNYCNLKLATYSADDRFNNFSSS